MLSNPKRSCERGLMIIRQPPKPMEHYVSIRNSWMRDERLSRRARGLLAELLTHEDGWQTTLDDLVRKGTEGRDAISTAIRELTTLGYLVIHQKRARGRMGEVTYTIAEPPSPGKDNQWAVDQWAVDQWAENQWAYKNTNSKKTTKKTTKERNPGTDVPGRRSRTGERLSPQRYLAWLCWQIEQIHELPPELEDFAFYGWDALTSTAHDEAIKHAKVELHHLSGGQMSLGEAFPDLDAGLNSGEWPPTTTPAEAVL